MITDSLFRSKVFEKRSEYNRIVQQAQKQGAMVFEFSGSHVSGQQLDSLTGIACILRFSLPLDYEDEEEDQNEEIRNIN